MTPEHRLSIILGIIIVSAFYGVAISISREVAHTMAIGYIVVVLTAIAVNQWGTHHGRK